MSEKRVIIFVDKFRYEGTLLKEDDVSYKILDYKTDKIIQIGKAVSTLKVLGDAVD